MQSSLKKRLLQPSVLAAAVALVVFSGLTAARHLQWLQRWELSAYDEMLRHRGSRLPAGPEEKTPAADPPPANTGARRGPVIIGVEESDIRSLDYPLRDSTLATLLTKLLAAKPRAIGLDLYRDLAEPRNGSELPQLRKVLQSAEDIFTIFVPDEEGKPGTGIPGPLALSSLPPDDRVDRICVNDFPSDGLIIRRAWLFHGAGGQNFNSLAFRLALRDLEVEAQAHGQAPPVPVFEPPDSPRPEILRLGRAEFHRFHGRDGGYFGAEDEGFQILLTYPSPAPPEYSVSDVLADKVPAESLRDRVILIGYFGNSTASVKDLLATPVDLLRPGDPLAAGVIVHAEVLEEIERAALTGEPAPTGLRGWLHPAWTLLWAVLGSAGALALLRWPLWSAVGLLAGLVTLRAAKALAFYYAFWLPSVEPDLAFILSALGTLTVVFFLTRRERSELMQLFSRHVSSAVADSIWAHRENFLEGDRPRSQKLTATVLFSDLVGFSTISEGADANDVMEWLNESLERLARQVESHHGLVSKYIGDSIMALFGVPVPRQSAEEIAADALQAVRCALKMSAELDWLNAIWATEHRPTMRMRIGIHTGELVAGSLGSSARLEFTVIGDTVNTASRLEGAAKDEVLAPEGRSCRILIGESTFRLVAHVIEATDIGPISLKGKANSVRAYLVLGEIGDKHPTAVT
jgi:adenylate cyclase